MCHYSLYCDEKNIKWTLQKAALERQIVFDSTQNLLHINLWATTAMIFCFFLEAASELVFRSFTDRLLPLRGGMNAFTLQLQLNNAKILMGIQGQFTQK